MLEELFGAGAPFYAMGTFLFLCFIVFLGVVSVKQFVTRWQVNREKQRTHNRKLELIKVQHANRLLLAEKLETTISVLTVDREMAGVLRDRLNEDAALQLPRIRIEENESEAEEEIEKKVKSAPSKPRQRKKSGSGKRR